MDNICHTLTGAAFGEAGLKQRTRFGNATLMIAANLPDLDALVFFTDTSGFSFRRGWTHGILAQALLPLALATLMWWLGRLKPDRGPRDDGGPRGAHFGWLLALSYVGVYSHVFLDYLNNYGIRLLAPLDWRWIYGDAVFIVDLFLWVALGAGIWFARRKGRTVFARGALVFAACYIAAMLVSAREARGIVADVWRDTRGTEPRDVMVGPVPLTPFTRVVIVDAGDRYDVGAFRWWPTSVMFEPQGIPKNHTAPEVVRAREQSPLMREFLVWARYPAWTISTTPEGVLVTVFDLRFMSRPVNGATFQVSTIVPEERGQDVPAGAATGASPDSSDRTGPR